MRTQRKIKKGRSIKEKTNLSKKVLDKDLLVNAIDDIENSLDDLEAEKRILNKKLVYLKSRKISIEKGMISKISKKEKNKIDKQMKELLKNVHKLNKKILDASRLREEIVG